MANKYRFRFAYTPGWTGIDNMEADRFFGQDSPPDLPLVRLYTWDKPTISLGCNQNPARRVDLALCRNNGIPLVQRPTGGRELLHGHDLCYCVAWPHEIGMNAVEAKKVFGSITDTLIQALAKLGITGEWRSLGNRPRTSHGPCFAQVDAGEITVGGKKLVASAQRVFTRCIIQEGSIPLHRSTVDLASYLFHEDKDALRLTLASNTACLREHLADSITLEPIVESFKQAFEESYSSPAGSADELIKSLKGNNNIALWYSN